MKSIDGGGEPPRLPIAGGVTKQPEDVLMAPAPGEVQMDQQTAAKNVNNNRAILDIVI